MRTLVPLLLVTLIVFHLKAQVVYEDIYNVGIYEFLDELANLKVIEINSVVKPYSRQYIAEKLMEAYKKTSGQVGEWTSGQENKKKKSKAIKLNKRQMKELMFYMQDYQFDARSVMQGTKSANNSRLTIMSVQNLKSKYF